MISPFISRSLNIVIHLIGLLFCFHSNAQTNLLTNIGSRKTVNLNGKWQYIVDPYETGFYDYRYKERNEKDRDAYWNTDVPNDKSDKKEHGWSNKFTLRVPGDWNAQEAKFLYYEGTVWYRKSFNYSKSNSNNKVFLYFGAVNYRADVFINGRKLGTHKGGFTPFNFLVPDSLLKPTANNLVVRVDNKRDANEVPTLNTDWWNYGGITRNVDLVEVPRDYILDYTLQIHKEAGKSVASQNVDLEGWIRLAGNLPEYISISIPELNILNKVRVTGETTNVHFQAPELKLWTPNNPKLYKVVIADATDKIEDRIGFRTIEASGKQILLNGKPLFLRGISIHEEIPQQGRRAYSRQDAAQLFTWVKELGCNMARLAHYPHDESMTRMADSLGILIWSEIPVYWTINFGNPEVFEKARMQLMDNITRDRNRASIIIWSVGNETPVSEKRTDFMRRLISSAKDLDPTRLVSAALEVNYNSGKSINLIDDPLGRYVDLVAFNEYLGWYGGLPSNCRTANWGTIYDKPLFISETGAEALSGFHADSLTRWSEEYQEWYYKEQVAMFKRMPDNFVGISPWILADFRSPRRNNPFYQNGWNRKGVIGENGKKKRAFYILKNYYNEMRRQRKS